MFCTLSFNTRYFFLFVNLKFVSRRYKNWLVLDETVNSKEDSIITCFLGLRVFTTLLRYKTAVRFLYLLDILPQVVMN